MKVKVGVHYTVFLLLKSEITYAVLRRHQQFS